MRHATRDIPDYVDEDHRNDGGIVVGAVVCAAIVVALFALHGAPSLLGDRFNLGAALEANSP